MKETLPKINVEKIIDDGFVSVYNSTLLQEKILFSLAAENMDLNVRNYMANWLLSTNKYVIEHFGSKELLELYPLKCLASKKKYPHVAGTIHWVLGRNDVFNDIEEISLFWSYGGSLATEAAENNPVLKHNDYKEWAINVFCVLFKDQTYRSFYTIRDFYLAENNISLYYEFLDWSTFLSRKNKLLIEKPAFRQNFYSIPVEDATIFTAITNTVLGIFR